jgi:hypothetical protein
MHQWKTKWTNLRPVCWDMTDVVEYEFTDPDMQCITYSQHFGHNCFKGGNCTQFYGWHGNTDLWTGAVRFFRLYSYFLFTVCKGGKSEIKKSC